MTKRSSIVFSVLQDKWADPSLRSQTQIRSYQCELFQSTTEVLDPEEEPIAWHWLSNYSSWVMPVFPRGKFGILETVP